MDNLATSTRCSPPHVDSVVMGQCAMVWLPPPPLLGTDQGALSPVVEMA